MFHRLLIVLLPLLFGCVTPESNERAPVSTANPLQVVSTTSMITDLVQQVGGEWVAVHGLMGPGVDPHLFQASEGDVSAMSRADVILYNGLHLEGKMGAIFEQMHERGRNVHAVAGGIASNDLLVSERYSGSFDPHIWFDPGLWQQAAYRVGEILATTDSLHAGAYRARAASYADSVAALFEQAYIDLSVIPENNRVLITSHDAFGYFGRAFDLEVHGLQGISTALEAGTSGIRDLAEFVAENQIPALFLESSISPRGIEAVKEAVMARGFNVSIGGTLYGDALGGPGSPAETYRGMLKTNVETIVRGLTRRPEQS